MAIANIATRDVTNQAEDEWEVYDPGLSGRKSAFFAVSPEGGVNLSKTARGLLGNPEWISVRINRSRGLIALVPSNQATQSWKISSSNGHIGLYSLVQEMNLSHGRYGLRQDGDMLVTNPATDHL